MSKSTIIVAGDLCLRGRTQALDASQLLSSLQDVKPIIQSADVALVNLETAVLRTPLKSIHKSGPTIATDKRVLDIIRKIGFTGVTLANNHFADYGTDGVKESLLLLDEYKLWHVGAGMNAVEASKVEFLQVGDYRVAIINACEHEFTIATDIEAGCNALNPIRQFAAIKEAKTKADYVTVIIHGGVEHYQLPTPRMQEAYRFFIDAGADAVINHHQHCYSGYEIYHGKPIVYGLGNFFFDWQGQEKRWNEGYMVKLTFDKEISLDLIPYLQNAETVGITLMEDSDKDQFFTTIEELNITVSNSDLLQSNLASWVELNSDKYFRYLQPEIGKNIKRLDRWHLFSNNRRENWIPEYLNEERKLVLKSLFQCESHQDVMNVLLK